MNNICFNERQNLWTTTYDWAPLVSENINGAFFSVGGLDYTNDEENNSIWEHEVKESKPTKWYDNQHAFEFEFVVSDPIGVNKIFDNIQIISNNVQPNELEISVIGDDYMFKRKLARAEDVELIRKEYAEREPDTTSNIHARDVEIRSMPSVVVKHLPRLNQEVICKAQPCKDIYKFGRRIGNIQYKNGSWFTNIEPLLYEENKEARIRDKWAKIKIKYTGIDLAVITAIRTVINV